MRLSLTQSELVRPGASAISCTQNLTMGKRSATGCVISKNETVSGGLIRLDTTYLLRQWVRLRCAWVFTIVCQSAFRRLLRADFAIFGLAGTSDGIVR